MKHKLLLFLSITLSFLSAHGQVDTAYVRAHALRITNAEQLSDSAYALLSPFRIIMFGEMHGTNESAPFVNGLARLFTGRGDSVLVGLEIPHGSMNRFAQQRTDSSIYQSDFFVHPPYESGKESMPWAALIAALNRNPRVQVFFFDVNEGEGKPYQRDSLMYANIKTACKQHPGWRVITLTGNFHNRLTGEANTASFLLHDKELNLVQAFCSLNMEYAQGTCTANFGHGLQQKALGSYPSAYNSMPHYNRYLLLLPARANYPYTGMYYTRYITAAKMTTGK